MEIDITQTSDQQMLACLKGRLDTPASLEAAESFRPLMDNADRELVMDCRDLTYISSSGLRLFLSLRKAAAAKGGKVILRSINADVRQVFAMTGLLSLFEEEDA
ncbi:MAG: STAS domain-containing protein [Bacteroidales bacterium]|nr:STAS domain-containing protein [Bacteroidales bacterium]